MILLDSKTHRVAEFAESLYKTNFTCLYASAILRRANAISDRLNKKYSEENNMHNKTASLKICSFELSYLIY